MSEFYSSYDNALTFEDRELIDLLDLDNVETGNHDFTMAQSCNDVTLNQSMLQMMREQCLRQKKKRNEDSGCDCGYDLIINDEDSNNYGTLNDIRINKNTLALV